MDNAKIYLCKADRSILGILTGLKTSTCNLTKNATDYWEITFEVERFVEKNGKLVQSDYYDSIDEMMKLYLDGDDQIFFVIDSEPVINGENFQETKTVTAHSIECELNDIYLSSFKINCGTYDSQEYLAIDDEGNFNNIDDYTGLPKEYISLVNYDNHQLSVMHLVLQGTDWTVKDDIDSDVCSIKKSFESSDSIYSFLMKTVSPAASVIFEFDRKHKQIGIVKVEDYGEDTGIFVTMRNLMNSFEVASSSQDAIMTKLIPTGANNLGIEQVNFGKDYIVNLDYFMNTLNEYGDYKFVSAELHDKYNIWKNYRETEKVTYNGKEYTRRELYIELTKLYNKTMLEINELHNRLPNDGCVIDYKTFSLEELKLSLNAYNKALVTLITLYKEEYGVIAIGDAPNYSPTPSTAVNIKDTPYWYDFYAYKEKIIPQVEQSLKMYCQTDSNGNLMTDSDGNFIELEFGNPDYYADETIIKSFDDYLYEWSLYGLDELESKKKAWGECANVLYNECFIASGMPSSPVYCTADDNGWNSLTDSQKKEFTSKDAFINKLNQYLDYMSFDTSRNNSLTNKIGKGIIRQCEDAITERKNEIATIEINQNQYNAKRAEIANSVTLENFKVNGTLLFTEKELNVIKSMIRTQDFSDEYILTTNLDDVVSTVDVQEELYQSAVAKLYEISHPQYSFSTELDNLYYLEEFKSYREPFEVGNFIRVGLEIHEDLYDNNFVKLRLISISYNPLEESEDLSVEFSTMTKSLEGISDLAFLIDKESSGSTSSSNSSSSSSGGGTYGDNDANVQISNNMLNALLKTEMFGTTVTDVILDSMKANKGNFNTLFAHSGVFSSLETGRIKVSGDCLFDRIKSSNWNGTDKNIIDNTVGSAMDLSTGKFNFACGKLKWDGTTLSVEGNGKFTGDIVANSLTLGQGATVGISSSNLTDANKIILKDSGIGSQSANHDSSYFNVSSNGLLTAENAFIYGTIYATNGKFIGEVQASSGTFNGEVNATSGSFTGDITANTLTANQSGSIAGWNFNSNAFYKNSETFGDSNGIYLGNQGFSFKNAFQISNNGFRCSSFDKNFRVYSNGFKLNKYVGIYFDTDISYMIVWFNDVANNEIVQVRFQAKRDGKKNGVVTYENPCYSQYLPGYNINYLYDCYNGLKFNISDFSYYVDENNYMNCSNIINIWSTNGKQIKCIEFYDSNNIKNSTIYNPNMTQTEKSIGNLSIDMEKGELEGSSYTLSSNKLTAFITNNEDFSIDFYKIQGNSSTTENGIVVTESDVKLDINNFKHSGVYDSTSTSGTAVTIDSDGYFHRSSSSSKRYKKDITQDILDTLNPHKLYDLNIYQFKYIDNYLSPTDQRYQKDIVNFIAEDLYEKYPIACDLNADGLPENPNYNLLIAPMLKLIQEQHKDIESLKEEIEQLKQSIR